MSNPIAKNPAVGIAIVIVLCGIAVFVAVNRNDAQPSGDIWFYDLGNNALYAAPSTTLPPDTAPSGSEGVAAVVMSCGDCDDETFTAYLQTYSDDYHKALDTGGDIPPAVMMSGTLVRAVDSKDWVNAESLEGRAIVTGAAARCGVTTPTRCLP